MNKVKFRWTGAAGIVLAGLVAANANGQTQMDSVPSFVRLDGSLLRAGELIYSLTLTKPSGQVLSMGTRTVTVSDSPFGGIRSWLIAEVRKGTMIETADSVFLARGDLHPERWSATIGRASLGVSFGRDSMFGVIDSYQGRSAFVRMIPSNALLSAGMLERIVELLPLSEGYRASATIVLIDGPAPRLVPAEISVASDERVQVGDRVVDCRTVIIRAGVTEQRIWIAKSDARIVRIDQPVSDGILTSMLEYR